jgi:acyl-CoA reductase-like NAD-dependent aldehyde dehydrogenase
MRNTKSPPATDRAAMDEALARLRDNARRFARLSLDARARLCRAMQAGMLQVAADSVRAACAAKGIPLGGALEGEEWGLGPWIVVRHLRLIHESLIALKRTGTTPIGPVGHTSDGRLSVRCFPGNTIDGALFRGVRVDVHLDAKIDAADLQRSRARFYHAPNHDGRVAAILGAGNVNAIVSQDAITKLFNEGTVCAVKMNPVNAYLGPYLERAYDAAIREGFLAILYGGPEEGASLVAHAAVDEIHITGSDQTFDRIVWGPPGLERDLRRAEGRPLLAKPITAELGNVSPVIVVPGPYDNRQLAYQSEDIASALTYNASFDCNAAKVLITPKGWPARDALLRGIEAAFAKAPPRPAYYPGARDRWERCTAGRRDVRRVGPLTGEILPWTLCPGLDPDAPDELGFRQESFCPVLFETSVEGSDPVEFLNRAVAFANARLWGTLNATVIVHPATLSDPTLRRSVDGAIGALRYGAVGVNAFPGLIFALGAPPWGAYPRSSLSDIQSGIGWVHNTAMLEGIEKAVLWHPLTTRPRPAYHVTHRATNVLIRRMTALEERGSWTKVPGVVAAALRG